MLLYAALCDANDDVVHLAGATITIRADGDAPNLPPQQINRWIERAVVTVADYYGRFPVDLLDVRVSFASQRAVAHATTYGLRDDGPLIRATVNQAAVVDDLDQDWVMTHEMVHLALPNVPRRSHWLEEGIATYVEPIARAGRGDLSPERVWGDMVAGLPNGLPQVRDRGLDNTPTWGRIYWGGALFCLLADIDIRRRTDNRQGLRDALRGVLAAGGNIRVEWSTERVLATADRAVGVPAMMELYRRMKDGPAPVDLDDLWRNLGVIRTSDGVRFNDAAPLAAIRRAITTPSVGGQ